MMIMMMMMGKKIDPTGVRMEYYQIVQSSLGFVDLGVDHGLPARLFVGGSRPTLMKWVVARLQLLVAPVVASYTDGGRIVYVFFGS
jgi:hypothetical protein